MVGGNCWRTTGDIEDTWPRTTSLGFGQAAYCAYAGPGHWNDPDLLMLGKLGDHPTRLTPNEQMTQISLWCMLSAPLLLSCDLTALDDFTLGLLTNDEVLSVNQDLLGRQAQCVAKQDQCEVWARDLGDGSKAVALFNRSWGREAIAVHWKDLGLSGKQTVRDLWRQKDLGVLADGFETSVPWHGVVLIRVTALP